jgi:hypothetical protein
MTDEALLEEKRAMLSTANGEWMCTSVSAVMA